MQPAPATQATAIAAADSAVGQVIRIELPERLWCCIVMRVRRHGTPAGRRFLAIAPELPARRDCALSGRELCGASHTASYKPGRGTGSGAGSGARPLAPPLLLTTGVPAMPTDNPMPMPMPMPRTLIE